MHCPNCNHIIPDQVRFCAYCGNVIHQQSVIPKKGKTQATRNIGIVTAGILTFVVAIILVAFLLVRFAGESEAINLTEILSQTTPSLRVDSTQVSKIDGMVQVYVPAGEFLMGSTEDEPSAFNDEFPQHRVYLDAYWIDQHEVTFGQFLKFLEQKDFDFFACAGKEDDHPVACVTWHDARAYCEWSGRRLPTEAEWEKAARGGLEGKNYPWGDEAPVCEVGAENGAQYSDCGGGTVPVKSFSPNGYGLYDMAGNVSEWVADWYDVYPGGDPEADDNFGQVNRVQRGGSWASSDNYVRAADRVWVPPAFGLDDFGFRCARSP